MELVRKKVLHQYPLLLAIAICLLFFTAYSVLTIVRHQHYGSFGYDLGINDQLVWKYSQFKKPLTTIDPFPTRTKLVEHVELVYAFISPIYWLWSSRRMLILFRNAWFCFSGIAVFLLAKDKKINIWVNLALVTGYLGFYGVQNAIWFDVHSASFAAAFLTWLIYFLERKQKVSSGIFLLLSITAKENIAALTFLLSVVHYLKVRSRYLLLFMAVSLGYLIFIFFIYFPHIVHTTYLYANNNGLLSNVNPFSLIDTAEKRQVIIFTLFSFGFIPLLAPLYLLPALGDLTSYFVVGSELVAAQGFFGHYRITLAPFLIWASVHAVAKNKWLNSKYTAVYLLICLGMVQYSLHLPLSYLTKPWFWEEPASVKDINYMIQNYLPPTASVVSQNNITPHISHRDSIYTLYPDTKDFSKNSPCGKKTCEWFRWEGNATYLIVDTSDDWDARHLLEDRHEFITGLTNLEKEHVIVRYKQKENTILYRIVKNPADVKGN